MKYSLMTHMIDKEIKLKKPTFIHILIMRSMGYEGEDPSLEEALEFLNGHGMPTENGSLTFRDCVRFAKENGFDGIDVMAHHFNETGEDAKAALDEYGITMSAVNIVEPFGEGEGEEAFNKHLDKVKDVIDRGAAAGCRNFLVMPAGYAPAAGLSREQIYQKMIRGLKACVAYGKEKGVTVNTETLESISAPLSSIGDMLRVFGEIPELKYSHDTGNPLAALEDPLETYELLKDRVVAVHFKDLAFTEKETDIRDLLGRYLYLTEIGKGVVDFKGHLQALKRDNYQGYITIEGLRDSSNQLDGAVKALQYLRKMERKL